MGKVVARDITEKCRPCRWYVHISVRHFPPPLTQSTSTLTGIFFSTLHFQLIRAIGSDQPLSVIASIRRFAMRSNYCAAVSVSSNNRYMVVSGSRVQHRWLPRSDAMVNNGLHIHVDISRSVFGRAQTVALWNGTNEDTVSAHNSLFFPIFLGGGWHLVHLLHPHEYK